MWLETRDEFLRAGIRADIRAELKTLDDKWSQRIDTLGERVHQVDRHVGEAKADLMRWSFVFWVGAVAAVAALAGVLGGR